MNKQEKRLIPELRFPEFRNEEEWTQDTLKNLSLELLDGDWIESKDQSSNGIRIIQTGNIGVSEFIHKSKNAKYISEETFKKLKCTEIFPGDCLVSRLPEPAGRSCFIPNIKSRMVTAVDCMLIRFDMKQIIPQLFVSYSQTHKYLTTVNAQTSGSTRERISRENLSKIEIPITSLKEQQKIASCLSSLDDVIAAHTDKLENLKQYKKALLQNVFPQEGETVPKLRFKEFENDGEWEEKTIIETANKKVKWSFTGGPFGSNLKASDYTSEGFRIIQLQNIGDGEFNDNYKIYTSEEKANELLSCNIYSGEIIISKMGDPVGRACIIPDNITRCVMASDGIRLVVDEEKYSKYFIYSLINSKRIRETIEKKATGSTRKRIGLDELKGIKLLIPKEINEQQKIASLLSSVDDLIQAEADKIAQLKAHKKGLLQGLFPKIES